MGDAHPMPSLLRKEVHTSLKLCGKWPACTCSHQRPLATPACHPAPAASELLLAFLMCCRISSSSAWALRSLGSTRFSNSFCRREEGPGASTRGECEVQRRGWRQGSWGDGRSTSMLLCATH